MKLTRIENKMAICEYPPVDNPEFHLNEDGYLMVHGYKIFFVDKEIGCAKGFDLKSKDYAIIGRYDEAKKVIVNIDKLIADLNLDIENCLFLRVCS